MKNYLSALKYCYENGDFVKSRAGNVKKAFGYQMRFDLKKGFPAVTTKKLAWKSCLKELLWFVKGDTSNETLQKQNVKIWNGNASREFLDSRGLTYLAENDLGPVYGHQWRFYNARYYDCHTDYKNKDTYKNKPTFEIGKQTSELNSNTESWDGFKDINNSTTNTFEII